MLTRLLFLALFLASLPAQARMYQWTDPETGTTQLSGKPPAWYRSMEKGPRVIVFEKGRVIDDTSISVSDALREELRVQALTRAVEDREKARQMALQAEELKTKIGTQSQEDQTEPVATVTETEIETALPEGTPAIPGNEPAGDAVYKELTENDLRALISEWEEQKTRQSMEKIGVDASPLE